jgi:N-acetylglucosaminyldiphosphoundecaprenol N-acetyl-beta-D-mannosaminyltransferase
MKTRILGIKIDCLTEKLVMEKIAKLFSNFQKFYIVTVNPEFILTAQKDQKFAEILNNAQISIADGIGLVMASKLTKNKIPKRIAGIDLMMKICEYAQKNQKLIYLLGGNVNIAKETKEELIKKFPKLIVAGYDPGILSDETWTIEKEKEIVHKINNSQADILFVAFGAPKQEKFIAQNLDKMNIKLAMGVGGSFDFIAKKVPRAPRFLQVIGLEWLFRLFKEPKRIKRIFNAVIVFPVTFLFRTFIIK